MKAKRRIRSLSLVSILVLLMTTLLPVSPAFAAISWSTKAPMPIIRANHAVGVVNGKVYAIGGFSGGYLATVAEYDPATNTWATKAPMPTAREALAVGVVNNKVYAIGGWNGSSQLASVEEYDPTTNTWATKAPMPTAREALAVGVVNNKVYAIGGWSAGGPVATVEEYDPATNTWTTKAPMPTARVYFEVGVVNNKVYAIGGRNGSSQLASVEEYDPATNTWATKAPMPTAREDLAAAVVNNKVYAIGGYKGGPIATGLIATVEAYDPVTNTWTTETSMPTARNSLAAGVVNNRIYAIGGMDATSILATNEEGIVPGDQKTVQVQASVDPTIELVINPTTLSFGNVNPSVGSYTQTKTATVKSNKNWQLLVRKVSDLTGANTNWVIPSSQLTFTSPLQTNAQFQTTDTLVNSGNPTASTVTNITYNLTVSWLDPPDSYSAEHTYTAIQP